MTVINSKRPSNMAKDKIHLAVSGSKANVLSGPIIFPSAGPTFEMVAIAPDRHVTKSNPNKDKVNVKMPAEKKYNPMNTMIPINMSSLMGFSPYLGTKMPCGCINDFMRVLIVFIKML